MSLLQPMQVYFRNLTLKRELNNRSARIRKYVNLNSAKMIGILFEATQLDVRQIALEYAQKLRKDGKRVTLLGFFNGDQQPADFTFKYFNRKQIDWALRPKSKEVDFFLQQDFDIFVYLNPYTTPSSEYIAALTNAHLKIGPPTRHYDCYDLMIDVKDKTNLSSFIAQMESILKKTNVAHEAASI